MNKREAQRLNHQEKALISLGFTADEAEKLRRISMTLHRWYELECEDGNGYIERHEGTGKPVYVNCNSRFVSANDPRARRVIADRETGAIKRLNAIIKTRNARITDNKSKDAERYIHAACHAMLSGIVSTYIQTDPRGAALYIIRPGDIPEGQTVESCYSRGIVVY